MSDEKRTEQPASLASEKHPDGAALGHEAKSGLERVIVRPVESHGSPRDAEVAHTREPRHRVAQPDILNIDEAAELLGVSIKTFNKVLHNQNMPARKIGREWKFSRQALIDWVGSGRSQDFYRESGDDEEEELRVEIKPQTAAQSERPKSRRTAGWQIEMD